MQLGTKPSTISEAKKGLSSPLKGCFSDAVTFVCSNGVSSVVFSMMLSTMTMVKPNISLWGYQNIVLLFKFVCHYFFFALVDVFCCDSIFFKNFCENTRLVWLWSMGSMKSAKKYYLLEIFFSYFLCLWQLKNLFYVWNGMKIFSSYLFSIS